ncbi:hypothetical protein EJF90_10230 [Neisseria meningitidis]|nr:hypothetical protein [Neisseria meningitidis]
MRHPRRITRTRCTGIYRFCSRKNRRRVIVRFGESAPADLLFKAFGFTVDNVVDTVKSVL